MKQQIIDTIETMAVEFWNNHQEAAATDQEVDEFYSAMADAILKIFAQSVLDNNEQLKN